MRCCMYCGIYQAQLSIVAEEFVPITLQTPERKVTSSATVDTAQPALNLDHGLIVVSRFAILLGDEGDEIDSDSSA